MKYMVMECHPAYAVVLSEEGGFHKVANLHYEVGQTVTDVIMVSMPEESKAKPGSSRMWVRTLSTLAACFLLLVTTLFYGRNTPYASVYMSINPEVRIDVNRKDRVVGMEGVNADGSELIRDYEYGKKDLDLVMDELVDRAIDRGYLHEGGKVTIQLDGDSNWVTSHSEHIPTHLNDHLEEIITVEIDLKPMEPMRPVPTAREEVVVIPAIPEHYGESDYGDEDDNDDGVSDYGDAIEENGQSDNDDGHTNYDGEPEGQGESGYEQPEDDGYSEYDPPEEEGVSNYTPEKEAGQTDYGVDTDDGITGYSPKADGDSGYEDRNTPVSDYDSRENEETPYKEPERKESSSDYEKKKDSDSDYEDDDD